LPDASNDFRQKRNYIRLNALPTGGRLVAKTNPRRVRDDPCRIAADLLDTATT